METHFRAITKGKDKQWVYGYYEELTIPIGTRQAFIHSFADWSLNMRHSVDARTVGQYTGFRDKNGKKIYSGDIVKTLGKISVVKFMHGAFIIGYHGGSSTAIRPQLIQNNATNIANRVEVLGNIWENPGLLCTK